MATAAPSSHIADSFSLSRPLCLRRQPTTASAIDSSPVFLSTSVRAVAVPWCRSDLCRAPLDTTSPAGSTAHETPPFCRHHPDPRSAPSVDGRLSLCAVADPAPRQCIVLASGLLLAAACAAPNPSSAASLSPLTAALVCHHRRSLNTIPIARGFPAVQFNPASMRSRPGLSQPLCGATSQKPPDSASSMDTIPEWDSMAHLIICLAIQDRFGVKLDMEAIEGATSVEALAKLVKKGQSKPANVGRNAASFSLSGGPRWCYRPTCGHCFPGVGRVGDG